MTEEELKALADRFRQKLALDPEIRSLSKKIADGTADFSDTSKLFWRRSVMLREYTQETVLDLAPEDRQRLVEALLHRGYDDTTEALTIVQETLDKAQGLHLNPVVPKYPAERVVQVAHALMDPTVPDEKIVRRAGAPVANVNMSFHDDYMKENAKIRAKLGFKCYLNRIAAAGCCKWCTDIAGRYVYGDQPDDVFHRHDNCGCTVTFENGRERQDVWSKRTWQASPLEVMRAGFKPVRNSRAQAEKLEQNALERLTKPGQGDIINSEEILARRERNTGVFSDLKMPMQIKTVKQIARKYGIDISGIRFKIQRGEEYLHTKLDYFGSTDYDNIGRVDLFPKAFADEEQLVRTMIHERLHVLQLRKYGKEYCRENLNLMERQAYWFEDVMYQMVRKRVNS